MSQSKQVDTKFGKMILTAVDSKSASFRTPEGENIVVNGVAVYGTVHFAKYDDSLIFQPYRTVYAEGRYHVGNACYLSRRDNYKDASPAAKKRVIETLKELLNDIALTPEGRTMFRDSEIDSKRQAVERAEREYSEALNAAEEASQKLSVARAALREVDPS